MKIPSLNYNPKNLIPDLTAGTTTALVTIPDGLASAILAGVNPVHGLYGLMVGTPIAALALSSQFMCRKHRCNSGCGRRCPRRLSWNRTTGYCPGHLDRAGWDLPTIVGNTEIGMDNTLCFECSAGGIYDRHCHPDYPRSNPQFDWL